MKKSNAFWGIILIAFGGLLLANQFLPIDIVNIRYLWPLFVLIPGLSMEIGYFSSRRNPGTLVPGGILIIIGLLFFFEVFTNWRFSEYTWPVYIFAVAFGLFQLYLFSGRNRGLLVPVGILTGISVVSFLSMLFGDIFSWIDYGLVVPIIFILLGVYILVRRK